MRIAYIIWIACALLSSNLRAEEREYVVKSTEDPSDVRFLVISGPGAGVLEGNTLTYTPGRLWDTYTLNGVAYSRGQLEKKLGAMGLRLESIERQAEPDTRIPELATADFRRLFGALEMPVDPDNPDVRCTVSGADYLRAMRNLRYSFAVYNSGGDLADHDNRQIILDSTGWFGYPRPFSEMAEYYLRYFYRSVDLREELITIIDDKGGVCRNEGAVYAYGTQKRYLLRDGVSALKLWSNIYVSAMSITFPGGQAAEFTFAVGQAFNGKYAEATLTLAPAVIGSSRALRTAVIEIGGAGTHRFSQRALRSISAYRKATVPRRRVNKYLRAWEDCREASGLLAIAFCFAGDTQVVTPGGAMAIRDPFGFSILQWTGIPPIMSARLAL